MQNAFKYLGIFTLLAFAASLTFCSLGIYNGFQTANRIFAGADNYTCRQFLYDLEHSETDKFAPMLIATVAYGTGPEAEREARQDEIAAHGMEPAVRKVYALCKGKPAERVINLFSATVTGATTNPSGTVSTPSITTPASN